MTLAKFCISAVSKHYNPRIVEKIREAKKTSSKKEYTRLMNKAHTLFRKQISDYKSVNAGNYNIRSLRSVTTTVVFILGTSGSGKTTMLKGMNVVEVDDHQGHEGAIPHLVMKASQEGTVYIPTCGAAVDPKYRGNLMTQISLCFKNPVRFVLMIPHGVSESENDCARWYNWTAGATSQREHYDLSKDVLESIKSQKDFEKACQNAKIKQPFLGYFAATNSSLKAMLSLLKAPPLNTVIQRYHPRTSLPLPSFPHVPGVRHDDVEYTAHLAQTIIMKEDRHGNAWIIVNGHVTWERGPQDLANVPKRLCVTGTGYLVKVFPQGKHDEEVLSFLQVFANSHPKDFPHMTVQSKQNGLSKGLPPRATNAFIEHVWSMPSGTIASNVVFEGRYYDVVVTPETPPTKFGSKYMVAYPPLNH